MARGQWRERGCAARVRHFSRSRRGSSTRTAQEAVGPLRQLRRSCRRFAGGGGCSLARLHVVEAKKAAETGAAFEAAITLAESGKRSEAEAAFADIVAHGTSGYRHLARMREAAELAQNDTKAAIAAYDQIAADNSVGPVLQDLASLRAGALLIDAGSYQEAQRRLEPLAANDRTFRHTAREFLVLAAWRAGDGTAAKRWFDLIMTDAQTPAATRSRVEMLMAVGTGASSG